MPKLVSYAALTSQSLRATIGSLQDNRPRSIYQYSSIASRLSGQNCKFFKFLLSSNSQKRLRYKENNTKYRSLTRKPRSHVRILIYRTWPIDPFSTTSSESSRLGILPYNRNVTLQTFEFFSAYARLYNAAASPASRLRSAGSLAIKPVQSLFSLVFRRSRYWRFTESSQAYYPPGHARKLIFRSSLRFLEENRDCSQSKNVQNP